MRLATPTFALLLPVALGLAGNVRSAGAQGYRSLYHPLTLAPADATSSGGGAGEDEAAKAAALAKAALNPVAAMISVPIQNNWDFGIGPSDAMKYTVNIQPVIPLTLNEDWNLISRTILPTIYLDSTAPGIDSKFGLGDTLQSFFFSPQKPVNGWILGAGPALLFPTATDRALGAGKYAAGPTAVVLRQDKGWTVGLLANHLWSYEGWGDQAVNATFLQPFLGFTTKKLTTFMVNTETTYDWHAGQATVPLNFMVTQLIKVGGQPLTLQLGYRQYVERPSSGPDWGLRFAVTFLFPK